ncbi:hypothetical protein ACOT81_04505 [Streptomyces sp. WI04-05B]|uniref:hypothetical protein n=1 Tax=Streptomyces TaxID=1883 RepID=UPI0029BA27EA|nr:MULTISPECIES: hypothetical protein [unclassified Streptomyces]MDX2547753.1 hypothetical protein [Streptomyces sp. WI04-05B]MDX2590066.1 hypothetical protein [Streptomyces sp. WI04-05A]
MVANAFTGVRAFVLLLRWPLLSDPCPAVDSLIAGQEHGKESATNGSTPAVGYQSGWTDPASGDVNMAARWYQPGTGSGP